MLAANFRKRETFCQFRQQEITSMNREPRFGIVSLTAGCRAREAARCAEALREATQRLLNAGWVEGGIVAVMVVQVSVLTVT